MVSRLTSASQLMVEGLANQRHHTYLQEQRAKGNLRCKATGVRESWRALTTLGPWGFKVDGSSKDFQLELKEQAEYQAAV